jgi:nucleoside-diphosphate-sugar epimerase
VIKVIITGGLGFVLSNVARKIHEMSQDAEIVLVDCAGPDMMAEAFLARFDSRVNLIRGDIRDCRFLQSLTAETLVTHVVHGAAITHDATLERDDPTRFIDVNFNGTIAVLEWLRGLAGLQRFIFVSTGGVYGTPSAFTPNGLQPESGPFDPPELYGATKYMCELVVRRYAELFSIPTCRVRPSAVFGPMERPTGARTNMSLPYRMAKAWQEGRPLRITSRSMLAGGDYIESDDAADAFLKLLFAPALQHDVYNIAAGKWRTVQEMLEVFEAVAPGFRFALVPASEAEVDLDPANRYARYNAYDVSRLAELDWRPRPLAAQFKSYLDWLQ